MERQRLGDEEVVVTILTVETPRADLLEALALMCHEAKREQCIVGTLEHPSRWDNIHAFIGDLLDLLDLLEMK